jgi:uncharacterized protein (DUF2267 family)
MKFRQLVKRVQQYSGFSDMESTDALQMMVESLAVHLDERERIKFASQLPEELRNIAMSVYSTPKNSTQDIVSQFMEIQEIEENRAKKQISSAWRALKEAISERQIRRLVTRLPDTTATLLH